MSDFNDSAYSLKVNSGLHGGVELQLPNGDYTVGRLATCDIVLSDAGIADEHARLVIDSDGITVSAIQGRLFSFGQEVDDIGFDFSRDELNFQLGTVDITLLPAHSAHWQLGADATSEMGHSDGVATMNNDQALDLNRRDTADMSESHRAGSLTTGKLLGALLIALLLPAVVLFFLSDRLDNSDVIGGSMSTPMATDSDLADGGVVSNVDDNAAGQQQLDEIITAYTGRIGSVCLDDASAINAARADVGNIDQSVSAGTNAGIRYVPSRLQVESTTTAPQPHAVSPVCIALQASLAQGNVVVLNGFVSEEADLQQVLNELDAGVSGITGFNVDAVTIGSVARQVLQRYIDDANLARQIEVQRQGNLLTIVGQERPANRERWSEVSLRFAERFPEHLVVRRQVITKGIAPIKLQAVWAGSNPYVILSDGQIYREGSTLDSGWIIQSITDEEVTLEQDAQQYSVSLL